jgi:hypothetical protein
MENKNKQVKQKKEEKKASKTKKPATVKEEQDALYSDLKKDLKDSISKMDDIIDENE